MTRFERISLSIIFSISVISAGAQDDKPIPSVQPVDSVLLEDITVEAFQLSGNLRNIPGSLSVISGENLNISDGTNLASVINTLPGITMQTGTYTTNRIVIRGMGSRTPYNTNRIRSYLNGIPLTTADGVSTPEEIDLQNLGRMEIIKGPSSALFGSGLGGSINLYTPEKNNSEGIIGSQYGSYNTSKTIISGTVRHDNANLWGSLSHLRSDGFRENNHYKRTSFISALKWKYHGWSVNTTLLFMNVDGGIPSSLDKITFENNPHAAAPSWKAINGYKKYTKGLAGITLIKNFSENIVNGITLFGRLSDNYEKRPFNNLDDKSLSGGVRNKLNLHFSKSDLILAAEWILEQYAWEINTDSILLNRNREDRSHLNIFSMFYYRVNDNINLSAAAALNHIGYRLTDLYQADGDQSGKRKFPLIFSPRIGINYTPGDRWALYASAGHGYSLPSPEETLLPEGEVNPHIKHEDGMQYEIGTRYSNLRKTIEMDVTLYWIELNNLLVTKRVSEDIFTGMNAGKTRHLGFEFFLRSRLLESHNFPGEIISVISYSKSGNRFIYFTDSGNSYDGNNLPGIPDQSVQLQLKWIPFRTIEVLSDLRHSGSQYLNDSNSLDYPGYFLSNLKVTARLRVSSNNRLNLYAGVNNLSDTHYASMLIVNALGTGNNEPRYYYPGLPRHIYAGIQLEF